MLRSLNRVPEAMGALALIAAILWLTAICAPASAQPPLDNDRNAVKEQQLLQQFKEIRGRVTIPDRRESVLEHPTGRDWRHFHEVTLRWFGSVVILGTVLLLLVFYLWRGTVRLETGRSGRKIARFDTLERTVHWMTAVSFIGLALTGLNVTYGKLLLLPLLGPEWFTTWSQWAKYTHNFVSFPFMAGIASMFVMWLPGNIPNRIDLQWLRRGGGIIGHDHPPAYRFNAGQKAIYWFVVLGGTAAVTSGYVLMFPFFGTNIDQMEAVQVAHASIAMLLISLILAHIYIGTIGMEGAFEAMGNGTVDLNWAREHHSLWLAEEQARIGPFDHEQQPSAVPAE